MADISTDQIVAFFNQLRPEQISKILEDIRQRSNTAAQSIAGMANNLSDVKDNLAKSGDEAQAFVKNFGGDSLDGLTSWASGIASAHQQLTSLVSQGVLLQRTLAGGLSAHSFIELGRAADGVTSSLAESVTEAGKMAKVFAGDSIGGGLQNLINKVAPFAQLADQAKNFESGLLASAAASGELGDLLENIGEDMSGLSLKADKFSTMMQNVSSASSFSVSAKDAANYARTLMQIPGAMDMTVSSTTKGIQDMHLLDAAIKVASGTGQNFQQVFGDMNKVYREFGTTGQHALEYVSRLSAASQSLKMPLELIKDYSMGAAESFRFLGDNTQATISVLGRFAPALKDLGMGPKAIVDLVGDITRSISQMGLAQKSFLSSQTGGAGGLQGGYQIDLLMQQGKMDEVEKKVEQSLRKQFGGKIVTLDEASKNQGAAQQMTKQVQLLTQGPTKIAGSESEAYRILDVLAKGGGGKGNIIKSPEESLKGALKTGDSLQERQANTLLKIQNLGERQAELAAISAYSLSRMAAGGSEKKLSAYIDRAKTESAQMLSSGEGGKLIKGQGIEQGKEVGETIQDFFSQLPTEGRNLKDAMSTFKDHVIGVGKEAMGSDSNSSGAKKKKALPGHPESPSNAYTPSFQHLHSSNSRPLTPNQLVAETLGQGKNAGDTVPAKFNSKQSLAEKLDITIHALCDRCNGVIAEEHATKVGKKLIKQHSSNKAMAVQLGHEGEI